MFLNVSNIFMFVYFQASDQVSKLYKMFIDVDATQIEINPFVETPDGRGKNLHQLK